MSVALSANPFAARRERVAVLAQRFGYAAEILEFYGRLASVQEAAWRQALAAPPEPETAPAWIAGRLLKPVVDLAAAVGPDPLQEAAAALAYGADGEALIVAWLSDQPLPAAERFFARASAAPVVEALPALFASATTATNRCPRCGGLPQLSWFAASDDPLLTGQRHLLCARCAHSWRFPRMVCGGCLESRSDRLPVMADTDVLPHLRVDACDTCHQYLVTVEVAKEPLAVPEVDELAAIPLDLYATQRGYRKVTANLMGF